MAGKAERVHERIFLAHKKANESRDFTIELSLEYKMHNEEWEGVCDQLGVAANADTLDETKEILRDLILLQLGWCRRNARHPRILGGEWGGHQGIGDPGRCGLQLPHSPGYHFSRSLT